MAAEEVCQFNKFGFCKFEINCFRKHENQKCENEHCDIQKCSLRHPKRCKYFAEFNKCKFGSFCKFKHDEIGNIKFDREIEMLRKDLENVKNGIKEKEIEIREKDKEIKKVSNDLQDKMCALEMIVKRLELDLQELRKENMSLRARVEEKEKGNIINNIPDELEEKDESDAHQVEEQVEENQMEEITSFRCTQCDFIGKNMAGLKIHDTAKHKEKQKPLMQRFSKVKK